MNLQQYVAGVSPNRLLPHNTSTWSVKGRVPSEGPLPPSMRAFIGLCSPCPMGVYNAHSLASRCLAGVSIDGLCAGWSRSVFYSSHFLRGHGGDVLAIIFSFSSLSTTSVLVHRLLTSCKKVRMSGHTNVCMIDRVQYMFFFDGICPLLYDICA